MSLTYAPDHTREWVVETDPNDKQYRAARPVVGWTTDKYDNPTPVILEPDNKPRAVYEMHDPAVGDDHPKLWYVRPCHWQAAMDRTQGALPSIIANNEHHIG